VTLEDAFAELGIDRDAGSDGARRAYLRLLKTRKPETDPEGFMRLRAAYELVKEHLPRFEAFRAREPAASAPPVVVATVEAAPAAIAPMPTTVEELRALLEGRPAVDEAAPAVVEPATDPGNVVEMERLLARSAHERAADQALLILAAATHRLGPPDPPVHSLLRLMLTLHSVGQASKAREVASAFKEWLVASGKESTYIRGQTAVLWAIVRELSAMKKGLPTRVRVAIARGALAGDLADASSALVAYRRAQPAEAEAAAALLHRKAPTIAAALAGALDPGAQKVAAARARKPTNQRVEGSAKWLWYSPLVIGLLRIFSAVGQSAPTSPTYSPPAYEMPRPTYPTMSFDAGALPALIDEPGPVEVFPYGVPIDGGALDAGLRGRSRR
jgi:hypothetical protein